MPDNKRGKTAGDEEPEAGEIKGTYQWPHTVEGQGQPSRQGGIPSV